MGPVEVNRAVAQKVDDDRLIFSALVNQHQRDLFPESHV